MGERHTIHRNSPVRFAGTNLVLAALFILVFFLSLAVSRTDVSHLTARPLQDAFAVLLNRILGRPEPDGNLATYASILLDIRLPRTITAAVVGAALAVSGCAMQGLLKNPLADGSILGISSGGSLGAVLFIAFGSSLMPGLSGYGIAVASIVFSFLSLLLILAISWRIDKGFSTNTIILLGVVFSMLAGSLTSLITAFSRDDLGHIVFWLMGSLSGSGFGDLLWFLPVCAACILFLAAKAPELNAFALGEEQAAYVGVNVRSAKLQIMVAVSALIGASVSMCGIIGFVGLVPPHIMRLFVGSSHKRLIPSSALFGGAFLMLADLMSRTMLPKAEIPIGIVTSLVGSVLFIYLYLSMRRKAA